MTVVLAVCEQFGVGCSFVRMQILRFREAVNTMCCFAVTQQQLVDKCKLEILE